LNNFVSFSFLYIIIFFVIVLLYTIETRELRSIVSSREKDENDPSLMAYHKSHGVVNFLEWLNAIPRNELSLIAPFDIDEVVLYTFLLLQQWLLFEVF
jgi:hypothetical protein